MSKDVRIPVKVEGADKAQQDLKKVGGAIADVGEAGTKATTGTAQATTATTEHAGAHGKAAAAVKKTTAATGEFSEAGRTALTGILGQINPALGSLANLALSVAKGIGGISPALLAVAAAGAAIGGVIKLIDRLREAARRAEEAIKRIGEAREKLVGAQRGPAEKITEDLRRLGGFSRANLREAYKLFVETMAVGVPEAEAAGLAGVGFAGGLQPSALALLAAAGQQPKTPEEAYKALGGLREKPAVLADLLRAVAAQRETAGGARAVARAAAARLGMERDSRYWEKVEGVSQDMVLLQLGKDVGLLKPEAGVERIDQLRREVAGLRRRVRAGGALGLAELSAAEQARLRELEPLEWGAYELERLGIRDTTGPERVPAPAGLGAFGPRQFAEPTRQVINTLNIGTAYLNPKGYEMAPDSVGEMLESGW